MDSTTRFIDLELLYKDFIIRELREGDLPVLAKWPKYQGKLLSWANFSASTTKLQKQWFERSFGPNRIWLAALNNQFEGVIARISISQPVELGEIIMGLVLRADLTGKGIGIEIAKVVLRAIFDLTDNESVWLETQIGNDRAKKAWNKIGFEELCTHYQRQADFRYHRMIGYRFSRENISKLPEITIKQLGEEDL